MSSSPSSVVNSQVKLDLWEKLVLQTSHDGEDFTFLSRVVDQSAAEVIIEYPTALEGGGVLLVGDLVKVSLTRSDAVWAFNTKVVAKLPGQAPRMKLAAPRKMERNQRRRFVRVDYSRVCLWRPIFQPGTGPDAEVVGGKETGLILNLSAGGVLLAGNDLPMVRDFLLIKPEADNWQLPGWLPGKVVWRKELPKEQKYALQVGVDFRDIKELTAGWSKKNINRLPNDILILTPAVRQNLIQFIYTLQIELRSKGLL